MQLPHVRHRELLVAGIVIAVVCWLAALETWEKFPEVSGFWVSLGLVGLAGGVVMGIIGWEQFWMFLADRPLLPLLLGIASIVFIAFVQNTTANSFFSGFWCLGSLVLSAAAAMFFIALIAGLLNQWSKKQE